MYVCTGRQRYSCTAQRGTLYESCGGAWDLVADLRVRVFVCFVVVIVVDVVAFVMLELPHARACVYMRLYYIL